MKKQLNSIRKFAYLFSILIVSSCIFTTFNDTTTMLDVNPKPIISAEPIIPSFIPIPQQDNAILLQAEDYDDCYDSTPGNDDPLAGFYKEGDADISQNFYYYKNSIDYVLAPSYKVSNIEEGEWLEWNVNFRVSDNYKFIIRITGENDSILHIEINDFPMIDNIEAPATGNKETWWQDIETPPIYIYPLGKNE